ncbi:MAG: hypothetical protein FWG59_05315, partial [Betaproteobacteria bacterium]|nr:hypothetical protein [Betaproteobacteria bacterium]
MYPAPFHQEVLASRGVSHSCVALRRMFRLFFAWGCACLALCAIFRQCAFAEAVADKNVSVPQWVYMPAGARAAYIGIHGGTVPVSLLTSRDGTHMVALVGQTGNDFLQTLKVDPGTTGALSPTPSQTDRPQALDDEEGADTMQSQAQAPVTAGLP